MCPAEFFHWYNKLLNFTFLSTILWYKQFTCATLKTVPRFVVLVDVVRNLYKIGENRTANEALSDPPRYSTGLK